MNPVTPQQQSRAEISVAVVRGIPGTECVREYFLIQHVSQPDGSVAVLGTMAWVPNLAPLVMHQQGIEIAGSPPDGIYSGSEGDRGQIDALGKLFQVDPVQVCPAERRGRRDVRLQHAPRGRRATTCGLTNG